MRVKRVPLQAQISEQLMALVDAQAKRNGLTRSKFVALSLGEFLKGGEATPEGRYLDSWNDLCEPTAVYGENGEVLDVVDSDVTQPNLSGRTTPTEAQRLLSQLHDIASIALIDAFENDELLDGFKSGFSEALLSSIDKQIDAEQGKTE